ncbi:hypothetical protein EII14_08105 [Alloprevotella sp. OH1205_COT-284]|nr:hypothetical protein EII14_08105 [Alloprevotella sp. OH1205_COT-284]
MGFGILFLFLIQTYAFTPNGTPKRSTAKDERIQIHHADRLFKDITITADGQVLVGNVHITHSGMRLKCDSAVFYEASNSFMAYGRVRFTQGDTLSLKGDSIYYDGTSQFAQVFQNVEMRHHKMTLYTDHLNYDRITGRGFYDVGGKIVDGKAVLTSQQGDYYTASKEAEFYEDVLLVNGGKDSLITDTLHYDTRTKWAHAKGPTNLLSGDSHIYTIDGTYNTNSERAHLTRRPQLFNKGRKLVGDSISYNKKEGFCEAFDNIVFTDSSDNNNKNILMGEYGYYDDIKGEAMATKRALGKNFSRNADTLYVHADTLRLYSYNQKTDSAYRVLHGYFRVRAYRTDVQAVCDSLVFNSKIKKLTLYRDPIAWTEQRQILGEEINVFSNDSTIDSIYVERQALLVEALPDSTLYNQVSGNLMMAYFRQGELYQSKVDGNAMLINFPMEKDSSFLYHNYCEAAKLRVDTERRRMKRFWAGPNPIGKTYPIGMAPNEHTRLPNFAWFDYIRPLSPEDVFEWRGKTAAAKLKHIPRRQAPLQSLEKASHTTNKGVAPPPSDALPSPSTDQPLSPTPDSSEKSE